MYDVRLDGVSKSFGEVEAVRNVSLAVDAGNFLSLLGPSGCGKTTLLRMLAGFVRPGRGEVYIRNQMVNDVPPFRRNVGMVFQNYALFPHLTVAENVGYGLVARKISRPERERRVEEALALVHLTNFDGRYPRQLSGGQQQRVALARAIVIRPAVLLLDEPLGSLDRKLRERMQVEVRQLQRTLGITTIFVTHDQEEALSMSDLVGVMNGGRLEQLGTPAEIYERPATTFVADFVGTSNRLDGTVVGLDGEESLVRVAGTRQHLRIPQRTGDAPGVPVSIMVRPEYVELTARGGPGDDAPLFGEVRFSAYLGASVRYEVELGEGASLVSLRPRGIDGGGYARGDRVGVRIAPECFYRLAGEPRSRAGAAAGVESDGAIPDSFANGPVGEAGSDEGGSGVGESRRSGGLVPRIGDEPA